LVLADGEAAVKAEGVFVGGVGLVLLRIAADRSWCCLYRCARCSCCSCWKRSFHISSSVGILVTGELLEELNRAGLIRVEAEVVTAVAVAIQDAVEGAAFGVALGRIGLW
jgi:hypothetical protein